MAKHPATPSSTPAALRRIPTTALKPGMFLVGVDGAWWKSPFFRHRRLLRDQRDIDLLRESGIPEVIIDPTKGRDIGDPDVDESDTGSVRDETSIVLDDACADDDGEAGAGEPDPAVVREPPAPAEPVTLNLPAFLEEDEPVKASARVRDDALAAVQDVFDGVKSGEPIAHPTLQHTVESLLGQVLAQEQAMLEVLLIHNLKQFDKALYAHAVDVAVLSTMVGIRMGLETEQLHDLALGGLLHDIGYMRVPRNLLRRKGRLMGEEEALMRRHVELGVAIVDGCPLITPEVRSVVADHHERLDGSGYPQQLMGDGISVLSDVVGFVDVFDGLVSGWSGSPSVPTAYAIRQLYKEAKAGRLRVGPMECLIRCLGVYPIGSFVALSSGEQGVVLKTNVQQGLKPVVKIIGDANGVPYDVPIVEDLALPGPADPPRVITAILNPSEHKVNIEEHFHV